MATPEDYGKYIIIENGLGQQKAVAFDPTIDHMTMAKGLKVVAAGRFMITQLYKHVGQEANEINPMRINCFGGCQALKLKPRFERDAQLLYKALIPNGK